MVGETKAQTWQLADLLTKNEVILRLIVKLIKNGISVPLVVILQRTPFAGGTVLEYSNWANSDNHCRLFSKIFVFMLEA